MPTSFSKSDLVNFYIDQGFTLFPLVGKIPPKGLHWRQCTFDPFFAPEGNFGVQLGSTDLVIDVDPRNGGDESIIRFLEIAGEYGITFCVSTGSGGIHVYLKKPPDVKIRKNLPDFKGLDFISEGGYVVGAGSIHPDTSKPYIALPGPIAAVTDKMLEIITKKEVVLEKGTGGFTDDEQTILRFKQFIERSPGAIEGESGDQATFTIAATGRDYGLSRSATYDVMSECFNPKCHPPWSENALRLKIDNAYKYAKGEIGTKAPAAHFQVWSDEQIDAAEKEIDKWLQRNGNGQPIKNLNNTHVLFHTNFPVPDLRDLLKFNEFSNMIEFQRPAPWHKPGEKISVWTDGEALSCKLYMSNRFKFEPATVLMHEAAYTAAIRHRYHPVKEYLMGLKWDGHKRCHSWLYEIMGSSEDLYTKSVGLKFLVAAVKRIFVPGCKFDYVLTLEGKQGTYKSTAFEILAINKEWYADPSLDLTNKDSIFLMFGKWIIELPEMETHHRSETKAMKAFLSRNTDRARLTYGRVSQDFPRQCVFAGTINPERDMDLGWLKDTTANRRYWPVPVGFKKSVDLDALRKVRDQLWAEAYQLYLAEAPIYMEDAKLEGLAEVEQEKRLARDPWQHPIEAWVHSSLNISKNIFTGEELYRECIGGHLSNYGLREMARVSRCMQAMGWEKNVYWDKNIKEHVRGYKRPEVLE